MGAAIECFDQSSAIVVPRTRFAPVKSTPDLLALRSDAYYVTEDHRLELVPSRSGQPPLVVLDPKYYQVMARFEQMFPEGAPSLLECDSFKVSGPVRFPSGVVCRGKVEFNNGSTEIKSALAGVYQDVKIDV